MRYLFKPVAGLVGLALPEIPVVVIGSFVESSDTGTRNAPRRMSKLVLWRCHDEYFPRVPSVDIDGHTSNRGRLLTMTSRLESSPKFRGMGER